MLVNYVLIQYFIVCELFNRQGSVIKESSSVGGELTILSRENFKSMGHPPVKVAITVLWATFDDVDKVTDEDKRHTLSFDTQLRFEVTKEMAKVDVEQLETITCYFAGATHRNELLYAHKHFLNRFPHKSQKKIS